MPSCTGWAGGVVVAYLEVANQGRDRLLDAGQRQPRRLDLAGKARCEH